MIRLNLRGYSDAYIHAKTTVTVPNTGAAAAPVHNTSKKVIESSWADVNAGVPQGSILGSLLFLMYINDWSNDLSSNTKLFADDTSLFSDVFNVDASSKKLNDDLAKD